MIYSSCSWFLLLVRSRSHGDLHALAGREKSLERRGGRGPNFKSRLEDVRSAQMYVDFRVGVPCPGGSISGKQQASFLALG